jgi:dTDP-4-dehydrorhamnose 3,5-epimerase
MHYQHPPHMEMKLVSCLRGEVWDVVVDIRADSKTFLQWYEVRLSAENQKALLIPEGFAHGFQSLTEEVEMLYCHSSPHAPAAERGINPRDERLGIAWPLPIAELSPRDAGLPMTGPTFDGVRV